jgi:murein DD-endopeptidase MepM/ murein hydrolase activator NlpD
MPKENLRRDDDGGIGDLSKQIKDLQTANPLENGSVDTGTLTIRSSQDGLVIEAGGQFLAKDGATILIEALLRVTGQTQLGDTWTNQLISNGNLFANGQLAVEGKTYLNDILDVDGTTDLRGRVNFRNDLYALELPEASSPTSMNIVLVDDGGKFYRGPKYSSGGTGGSDNPTSPGGLGEGPAAPFSYQAFSIGNGSGEADFGTRNTAKGWHDGLDFAYDGAGYGAAVRSVATGTVVNSSYANHSDAGPYPVCIDHGPLEAGSHAGRRLYSVYWHMLDRTVSVGDSVTADTVIGHVGAYGNVTGPHLHLELHLDSLHSNWPVLGLDSSTGAQDPVPIFNEYGGWR